MNKVIAIVGMCGSGKSIVADRLSEKGLYFIRFGQITLDIVKERSLEPNEANEKAVREEVRKKHGMAAYAILNLPKIKKALESSSVVIDGLYSWSEYKILKKEFGQNLIVIAVYAPPELRHKRISERKLESADKEMRNRPFTMEDAKKRDYNEIENIEKGGPIAMADYIIANEGTKKEFELKIGELLKELI